MNRFMIRIRACNLSILNVHNEQILPDMAVRDGVKASEELRDVLLVYPISEEQLECGPETCHSHVCLCINRWIQSGRDDAFNDQFRQDFGEA